MPFYVPFKSKINFQIFSIADLEKGNVWKWFKILSNSVLILTYSYQRHTQNQSMDLENPYAFERHSGEFITAV